MGTSSRLINIDPTHARRPSKMVITKRRAELKYKPPDPRYPHPSQASVDHPGPSSTASTTWSQSSSANCKAVATLKRSRQSRPYRPSSEHLWTRGHSHLHPLSPPAPPPSCPLSSQAPSVHYLPCAASTPRESECLEVGRA